MPKITVHGASLYYEDTGGDGEPVLFLHGFLFDGRQFEAQIAALRDSHRCVALDFRGQGRSADSPGGYQIEQLTADVLAVIRELELGPLHLAGLSMGGFVGLRIAARHPGLLRSLTLLKTSAGPHNPAKVLSHLLLTAVGRIAGVSLPLVVSRVEAELYGAPFRDEPAHDAQRLEWRERWAHADRAALAKTMLGIAFRPSVRDELADIKIPVLIIAGGADVSLPPAQSRQMHSLIPGSRLVELPGVGHSSPIEDPGAVTNALTGFLTEAGGGNR